MDVRSLEELERAFKALSNINRLKLLVQLQRPKGYSEIELTPSRPTKNRRERPISRQAVRSHVQELEELGVIIETEHEGRKRRFVVDRSRLFAIVERMRELATVQSAVDPDAGTMELTGAVQASTPEGPHLALVRGVEEGRMFPLESGTESDPFVVGRSPTADASLGYDGFVSGEHAHLFQKGGSYLLRDLPQNKNGTFLNWHQMEQGGVAALSPGDVVGVGRSLLVFRE